jgi:starch synthase
MNILLISTEATPYFKTGGVADVVSGLAKELNTQLHDARIILPYYRNLLTQPVTPENVVSDLKVPLGINAGNLKQPGAYFRYANIVKTSDKTITYFVEQDFYFGRDNLYGYPDDYERFIFFCQATVRMLMDPAFREKENNWFPEIIQGYDWAASLMPGWIHEFSNQDERFSSTRFILNIHNIRRMGVFGSRALQLAQQFENGIYPKIGETDEQINFLGRGILFADKVVTVNPNYTINEPVRSGENYNPLPKPAIILKSALDQRLEDGDLVGIRNGIDEDDYNPGIDDIRIAKKFARTSINNRIENKRELQNALGLIQDDSVPLLGMVSKLIPGNGFEFLECIYKNKANLGPVQLVVLGDSAVPAYRDSLRQWENEQDGLNPWIKSRFQFDDSLARLIYAAADIYLLPVSELPSGINQYIAMRYGAVPLVFHTGSLCHSVENYVLRKSNAAEGAGIGFKFYEYSPDSFLKALEFALSIYSNVDKSLWRNIQLFNMRQTFNWAQPASDYDTLYRQTLSKPAKLMEKGTLIRLDHDMRLLQALLEIDNLPGLGNREPQEILKQAARIIRGVLECDAVYVWDTEKRLGKNDLEPSLDYTNRTKAPDLSQVALMLNKSKISIWGQLGDSDLNGNCQPIPDLNDFEFAQQQGWISGKSVPIVAHARLLGRIDIFLKEIPDEKKDQWQATALTALASSFGQRLSSILDAIELDRVASLSKELLDIRSFDDTTNKIINWGKLFSGAQKAWLYFSENGLNLLTGDEQEDITKMANSSFDTNRVISIGDWIQAPRQPNGHRLYRSLLCVPLKVDNGDQPTGVIILAHENPFAFSHGQEQLVIKFLSQQAAIAMTSALSIKERDNTRLAQLETLSKSLVSTGNYIELLNKIVTGTMSVLRAQAASLYLFNSKTQKLEIMAAAGYHEPLMHAKEKPSYNLGEGVTGWIAQEGKIFKADSKEELHSKYGNVWKGKFKKLQKDREPNAFLGIPLKVGNLTIGILKLEDRVGSSLEIFSNEDVLLGSMMGNVIATVVYNYRVSDQTNETKLNNFSDNIGSLSSVLAGSQDRQALMNNIVEKIKDVLHVSAASLFLADEKRENLEIQAASGYQKDLMLASPRPSYRWGEGVTGRIAENNKPVLANSLKKLREIGGAKKGKYDEKQENKQPKAFYGMPLNVEGEERPIGVLKVESLEPRPFTDEDVLLITMMGNVIAAVVHNAQISEKKLADFNENIRQLSSVLAGAQARKALMENIVEKIKDVLHVSAASLFLADEKRENLEIQAASGYQKDLMLASPRPSYRWGEGVTGRIAEQNQPVLANSLDALRRIGGAKKGKYDEMYENKQPKAFYGMPLNVEGEKRPIGVLKVESLEPRPFTDEDVLLITMMGNVIAAVVYNVQISDKKLADFNENIRQLSSVLAGSQDRQTLMDNIVEKIQDVLHVSAASLFLADEKRENLEIQAASGYQQDLMLASPRPSYRWGEGVTGRIAQQNKPILANSLEALREIGGAKKGKYDEGQKNKQPKTFYGMPLNVEGEERPIGVLKVESLELRPFTDEDVLLITMMGNVIAAVVYNAQISEKKLANFSEYIRRLSDVLTPEGMSTQEWFQKIVDRISDLFTTDAASLYLIDDASGSLMIAAASGYQKALIKAKASYELKEGVTGTIADTGLPIGANKLAELREHGDPKRGKYDDLQGDNKPNSYYGVPLKVTGKSKPIGVLKFESLKEGFFSAENRLLIDMMANVIGTVIANIQQGEKRIGLILSDMGTLANPIDVSNKVLAKYASERDSGLIDQLAFALSEDLGNAASTDIEAEAEKIFIARKQLKPELRPELYERISVWARHLKYDRVEWQFNLYHSILASNTKKYENWHQVRDVALDWIALKTNVGQPVNFQKAASKIAAELAAKIGITFSPGKMDSSSTWFQTILETKDMFGDEIQHILMLFQCGGDLDEINQNRLASLASQDEEHPYPVLLVVQWNTGITKQQKDALRKLLAVTAKDVAFADIKDLLKLFETVRPDKDFRELIKKQVSITSPFVTEGDVPDDLFFGRDAEIKTLATNIGYNYAVIGNRKIGKTSLLKKVERIFTSKALVKPIYINCNAVMDDMGNFYNKFQEDSGIELAALSPQGFDQAVRRFARQDRERKPVFLIDEADRALVLDMENGGGLVKICRGLSQDKVCNFIFFGSTALAALRVYAKSDLFNFATSIHLGYLSKDISRRVLLEPLEKIDVSLEDPDYITDKVFEITSGHPNLVQKIGSLLINYANDNNHRITREHIDQICKSSSFRDYFLNIIWGDSGPLEKLITLTAPALDFTYSEITTALKNSGILLQSINEPSEPHQGVVTTYNNVDNALKMLGDLSVLKEEAGVYHFIPRSFQNMLKLKEPQKIKNEIDECLFKLNQKGKL